MDWRSRYELVPGQWVQAGYHAGAFSQSFTNSIKRLLNSFQSQAESSIPSLTQTELYIAYANRFPSSTAQPTQNIAELHDFEAKMESQAAGFDLSFSADQPIQQYTRLLNPVELITLARMAFAKCEPCVDEDGRFVIRGLERREGVEQGKSAKSRDMFPFASASGKSGSVPVYNRALTSSI